MTVEATGRHWRRTRRLVWLGLLLWLLVAVAAPLAVNQLNLLRAGGFPLGFYVAAQGAAVLATALTFLLVWRQEAIDRSGAGEEGGGSG